MMRLTCLVEESSDESSSQQTSRSVALGSTGLQGGSRSNGGACTSSSTGRQGGSSALSTRTSWSSTGSSGLSGSSGRSLSASGLSSSCSRAFTTSGSSGLSGGLSRGLTSSSTGSTSSWRGLSSSSSGSLSASGWSSLSSSGSRSRSTSSGGGLSDGVSGNLVVVASSDIGGNSLTNSLSGGDLERGNSSTRGLNSEGSGVSNNSLRRRQWAVGGVDSGLVSDGGNTGNDSGWLTSALLLGTGLSDGGGLWNNSSGLSQGDNAGNWSPGSSSGEWAVSSVDSSLIGNSGDTSNDGSWLTGTLLLSTGLGDGGSTSSGLGDDSSATVTTSGRTRTRRAGLGRRRTWDNNSSTQVVDTVGSLGFRWVQGNSEVTSVSTWNTVNLSERADKNLLNTSNRTVESDVDLGLLRVVGEVSVRLTVKENQLRSWLPWEGLIKRENVEGGEFQDGWNVNIVSWLVTVEPSVDPWGWESGWGSCTGRVGESSRSHAGNQGSHASELEERKLHLN
ncbi:hypothetical protein OGAPHI_004307 [Ogataea philodendri]|uniref:Uncharacterized protein n=1 Tax=Ogataea philodendri TaxID=1378263 RepID=A0A9P8P5Y7_9ASCO|nr:uncharacterized protein OGAPHI_004307 [Ogataea philodendri]KAH3666118.1 hypothetical protein OGAPHI_004307 [Ogataea philodendri]